MRRTLLGVVLVVAVGAAAPAPASAAFKSCAYDKSGKGGPYGAPDEYRISRVAVSGVGCARVISVFRASTRALDRLYADRRRAESGTLGLARLRLTSSSYFRAVAAVNGGVFIHAERYGKAKQTATFPDGATNAEYSCVSTVQAQASPGGRVRYRFAFLSTKPCPGNKRVTENPAARSERPVVMFDPEEGITRGASEPPFYVDLHEHSDGSPRRDGRAAAIERWAWDFGDGTRHVQRSVPYSPPECRSPAVPFTAPGCHSYAAAGTYTITLEVTNEAGRTASASRTITVGPRA